MIECVVTIIQSLCQTMDLETLNLHMCQFFPTNHVRHPLSDHLKGSLGMFDLEGPQSNQSIIKVKLLCLII